MQAFFVKILQFIGQWVIEFLFGKLVDWFREQQDQSERKRIDEENLKKYSEAISAEAPASDLSRLAENLLNHRDSSKP